MLRINAETWDEPTELPPIPSSYYPIAVKDEFIAYSLDYSVR
jgi:hypothetical protein